MTSHHNFSQSSLCLEDYSYQDSSDADLLALNYLHFSDQSPMPLAASSKKINKEPQKNQRKSRDKHSGRKEKCYWQPEEDAQVLQLVAEIGCKWTEIGRRIGQRTGKQVRDRYNHFLHPNISKDKWTRQEDEMIISLYRQVGNKWCQIAQEMPGRTDNQVKNRFYSKIKGTTNFPVSLPNALQKSPSNQEGLSPTISCKHEADIEQVPGLRELLERFINNHDFYLDFVKEPLYEKEILSDIKKEEETEPTTLVSYPGLFSDAIVFDFCLQDVDHQIETGFFY